MGLGRGPLVVAMVSNVTGVDPREARLVRNITRERFFDFVQEFWHTIVPEEPVWNWHIPWLCDRFQEDAERVFRGVKSPGDTVCNVPPGTTKSTILSIMAPAWVHARMPSARVLAASHTQQLTFELGRKSRMVEQSPLYRAAFPEVVPAPDQNTKSLYMNTMGGGRMACTVGGMSPIGFHAHFLLVDDPLDPVQAKAATAADLDAANNFMSEVLPSRKVNKETACTWLIMQRLHQNDPSGYLLEKKRGEMRHICLPAQLSARIKPARLRRKYVGGLLDPIRLSTEILRKAKLDLGEYGYSGQFRQHPVPPGGGMFKIRRLNRGTRPPSIRHGTKEARGWMCFCRFWDKAGTKDGGAFTVGLLMGRWRPRGGEKDGSDDQWWVLDVVRDQVDAGVREQMIKDTARQDAKLLHGHRWYTGIEQEPGSGGKESAQRTVKMLAGITRTRVMPAVGTKEDRADMWATVVNVGGFYVVEAEWTKTLLDEMEFFPYSTYKDQIDAGSGAFAVCSAPSRKVGAA